MPRDAISLDVYRRNGKLYVRAAALSPRGFQGVEWFPVARGKDGLLRALEAAERVALELTKAMPRAKRFEGRPELGWSGAGASSWTDFVKGVTEVDVVRDDKLTELAYWVPSGRGGLTRTILQQSLEGKRSLADVATAVTAMFARADREKPRIETAADLGKDRSTPARDRAERLRELAEMKVSEAKYLRTKFGRPSGEVADGKQPHKLFAQYWVCDDVDVFVYFVTLCLAGEIEGGDCYELGLEIDGTYSKRELQQIARALIACARRLTLEEETIVSIPELAHLFPKRNRAYVADFFYRTAEFIPTGMTPARLVFLRPVFEEEVGWIEKTWQGEVGVAFLEAEIDPSHRERAVLRKPKRRTRSARSPAAQRP